MKKFLCIVFLLFFIKPAFTQQWKRFYDSALVLQNNNDTNAIQFYLYAKSALPADSLKSNTNAQITYNIAYIYQVLKRYQDAEPFYIEAKSIWEKILGTANAYYVTTSNNLAALYYFLQQYDKAEALLLETLPLKEKLLGKNDPEYIKAVNNLAQLYWQTEQYAKAEPLYIEIKNFREKTLGTSHSDYASIVNTLGLLYSKLGQFVKAESFYQEAMDAWATNTASTENYYTAANNLAALYFDTKQYKKAESIFISILKNKEKILGKESEEYLASLAQLGTVYFHLEKYALAEPIYLTVLNYLEKKSGKNHVDYAQYLNALGGVYTKLKQYEKAEPFYLESKQIREKLLGKEHPLYAASCNNLGLLYSEMGNYKKSEAYYLEAKTIREKILGKDNAEYANTCHGLGTLYMELGQYEKAKILITEAKNTREKIFGKNHVDYANSCSNLASFYMETGEYEKSLALYIEARDIDERIFGKTDHNYATALSNLAVLYGKMDLYEKGEPLILEAKNIDEKVLGKNSAVYALACNNLASLYQDMGQYERSLQYYQEAKNVFEKSIGKLNPEYATCCGNIAGVYALLKNYTEAESLFLEGKTITEKLFGTNHHDYATVCNNLAALYAALNQEEKVLPLYLQSLNIYEKIFGKMHPSYAIACNSLGATYLRLKEFRKAEQFLLEAKQIREKVLGKNNYAYSSSCMYLGELYWRTNRLDLAEQFYKEKFEIEYSLVQNMLQFTSEKEKASFIKNIIGSNVDINSFYFSSFPYEKAAQPFTMSFLSRNLILSSSQLLRKSINNSGDSNALSTYERWVTFKKQLAALYSKNKSGESIKILEDSINILEKNLARRSGDFKKKNEEIKWTDIQKNLKDGESAVEFVAFRFFVEGRVTDSTNYVALVLRKDKPEPIMVPLFEKKQLDSILLQTGNKASNDNVKTLYASRGVKGDDTVVMNKSLYKLIWGPLENELKGINTVYFAPDGLLHRIAFAALPVNDKEVLSDKYRLVELSTTANIIDRQPVYIASTDKINLYGGIQYNADTTALKKITVAYHTTKTTTRSLPNDLTRGSGWNDLPGTKKETDGIVAVANNNNITLLSGIQATEESVKTLDGKNSPVVLHIATHGFFFPDPKEDKTESNKTAETAKAFKQSDDPLFRSGLLFAGANTAWNGKAAEGIEDGILTSYEVSNMYLPNTKLVVLSACETGLGDIQGAEGVYGLQRAFKMAGAENLIMSLWKVPDAETAEFMQVLYKNLFSKQSISDAFYNAQTTMKNKYRTDPYKWAAWVLVR